MEEPAGQRSPAGSFHFLRKRGSNGQMWKEDCFCCTARRAEVPHCGWAEIAAEGYSADIHHAAAEAARPIEQWKLGQWMRTAVQTSRLDDGVSEGLRRFANEFQLLGGPFARSAIALRLAPYRPSRDLNHRRIREGFLGIRHGMKVLRAMRAHGTEGSAALIAFAATCPNHHHAVLNS